MTANDRTLTREELVEMGFRRLGADVRIDRNAVFINPDKIELGDHCRIDAFVLISGGAGVRIGRNVHIAVSVCIFGGGGVTIGDFVGISARTILYSSNDDYSGEWLTGPTVPAHFTNVHSAPLTLGRHVLIGAGSIVLPGVTLGEGVSVGAMSLVRDDAAPFLVIGGVPARPLKQRKRNLLRLERDYLAEQGLGRPSLEVHVPISPTPSFFTMVECLAASLRAFAGSFGDVRMIVSVGEDIEPFDIEATHPSLRAYGIEWRWVERGEFRQHSYFATGMERWSRPFEADYVLMADADILILNSIADLIDVLPNNNAIAGCIATFPPFMARDSGDDRVRWPELFERAGLPPPRFDHPIPGYEVMYAAEHMSHAPPYYNFGFVFGARDGMNAVRHSFRSDYLIAADYMKTDLAAQAGLCLSIVRHGLAAISLPVRYNFWAHETYYEAFPRDRDDVRVLHYLNGPFRKHEHNHSMDDVKRWIEDHEACDDALSCFVAAALMRVVAQVDQA